MKLSIIAAIGKNNELGKDNKLIWNLPNDLRFFKEMTTGKTILMGRKTFESLPKILPNRKHIVLTFSTNFKNNDIEIFNDIDSFINKYQNTNEEIFIIGGASIYKQFLSLVDKMYLTEIDAEEKSADTYFPKFDSKEWEKEIIKLNKDNNITYKHVKYLKKQYKEINK